MNTRRSRVLLISMVFCGLAFAVRADKIQSLIKQLSSWNTDKAKKASDELAAMGKIVVPEVAKALRSSNRRRGRFAARTLREIGQDAADAIPALSESLKDSDALTREYSVEALGKMLRQADRLIPLLQKMTEDENEDVRAQARLAVLRLTEALESPDQPKSSPQSAADTSPAAPAQDPATANPAQHAASQPGANVSNSSGKPEVKSQEKEDFSIKISPMLFIRFALFMFVPVGFFSLLYFYREHA